MKKGKRPVKYFVSIFIPVVLFICIWGIPLKETAVSVKSHGTNVNGTFTGTWSPVKGKEGTFTAEEGWTFEGIINPDGGLWKGKLTNFPIPPEWRECAPDLPEIYTGAVEENTLSDIKLKNVKPK